jgi:RNA polymerase sigma-70 factor (TIGR02957 family)
MPELESFQVQRPRLFSIAYRMLGSATEAEDVLQDTWLRLRNAEPGNVRSPQAFAATIVTRLCLDRVKSARARREEYVGPWLPEPVLTAGEEAPDVLAERSESVTLAFLLLLDTLSPEERAVFLLKEVYDYEHGEIAGMLGTTPANCRQLLHRARSKIRPERLGGRKQPEARRALAATFAAAFQSGDATQLAQLLAADVTFVADGGGKAAAARRPLEGRDAVLKLLVGIQRSGVATGVASQAELTIMDVNSEPALVLRIGGKLDGVFVLAIEADKVAGIRVIRNPDKLAYLERQLTALGTARASGC